MFSFFDIFGGSKRRSALQVFDRTLGQLEVNPAYVDDGMRFAVYKWANLLSAENGAAHDYLMREAAALISFCVLGPAETEVLWGPEVRAEREARFDGVIARGEEETFDALVIKLTLAKNIAAPDIRARVALETEEEKTPTP